MNRACQFCTRAVLMASVVCATAAGAHAAAGKPAPGGKPIESRVPGAVAGWKVDREHPATAGKLKTAHAKKEAEDLIDGSAEPFYAPPFSAKAMAWQNYAKGRYRAELNIWQMPTADQAQKLWTAVLADSLYAAPTWEKTMVSRADEARVSNTGTTWWVNARKGAFHVEVKVQPSYEDDKAGRAAALSFAAAVLRKL